MVSHNANRRTLLRLLATGTGTVALGDAVTGASDGSATLQTKDKIGEVGTVTIDQPNASTFRSVAFDRNYDDPVVVMKPVSYTDGEPCHVRVQKVAPDGFEFKLEEWAYQDGTHSTETMAYLAVEEGVHSIKDVTTIEVGTAYVDENFTEFSFGAAFDEPPVLLAQSKTTNGGTPIVVRQQNVTDEKFELKVQEEEGEDGSHHAESVGWVAMAKGSGTVDGSDYEVDIVALLVGEDFTAESFANFYDSPAFVADIQTTSGGNPAELRYRNLTGTGVEVKVEEEQSADFETSHADEQIGFATFEDDTLIDGTSGVQPRVAGEVGTITTDQPDSSTFFEKSFDTTYDDPIVIMKPVSYNGGQPCHVRLRGVTGDGFKYQLEEWEYLDGSHTTETVAYLAVERGRHTLSGGAVVEAGSKRLDHVLTQVNFSSAFDSTPVVFGQSQAVEESTPVVVRQRTVTTDGLEMELQEEEANDQGHLAEPVGYVAFEPASGTMDGGDYEVGPFDQHVSDDFFKTQSFTNTYSSPAFLANMQTTSGGQPCNLRYRNLTSTDVEVILEEEQSADSETDHADEEVAYATFEAGTTLFRE